MAQTVVSDRAHIINRYQRAFVQPGMSTRHFIECKCAARTGAYLNPSAKFFAVFSGTSGGRNDGDDIALDMFRGFDGGNFSAGIKNKLLFKGWRGGCCFCRLFAYQS